MEAFAIAFAAARAFAVRARPRREPQPQPLSLPWDLRDNDLEQIVLFSVAVVRAGRRNKPTQDRKEKHQSQHGDLGVGPGRAVRGHILSVRYSNSGVNSERRPGARSGERAI